MPCTAVSIEVVSRYNSTYRENAEKVITLQTTKLYVPDVFLDFVTSYAEALIFTYTYENTKNEMTDTPETERIALLYSAKVANGVYYEITTFADTEYRTLNFFPVVEGKIVIPQGYVKTDSNGKKCTGSEVLSEINGILAIMNIKREKPLSFEGLEITAYGDFIEEVSVESATTWREIVKQSKGYGDYGIFRQIYWQRILGMNY